MVLRTKPPLTSGKPENPRKAARKKDECRRLRDGGALLAWGHTVEAAAPVILQSCAPLVSTNCANVTGAAVDGPAPRPEAI